MRRPQPDLAGFAESRQAIRDLFGQDVTFLIPKGVTYAPGTTDPESKDPWDPWATPASGGGAATQVVKHVSVVNRPMGGSGAVGMRDTVRASPIGNLAHDQMAVILPFEEWPDVAGATHVLYLEDRYKITEVRDDAMATVYRRKIIYLTKA